MMKKTTLLLPMLLLSFYNSFSQTFTEGVDDKLQLLNKIEITTDILYDRVYPMANLFEFNQTEADTSNVNHFYCAYGELQTADYLTRWNDITALKNEVVLQQQQNKIPIGILNIDFEHFDELAYQDNLVDVQGLDSLLVDVPGRGRSPYMKKNALVISPLVKHTKSTNVTFITNNIFTTEAATTTITSVEADFDNGQGWQLLPAAGTLDVTFTNTGMHYIEFKITLSNGAVTYTYASLKVFAALPIQTKAAIAQKAAVFDCNMVTDTIMSSRTFQGYDETEAYPGIGEYRIFQGGAFLDNPVIVIDGFDFYEGDEQDGTDVNDIYNDFLEYNDENDNLGDDLRNQGFDIITLNFTRYIADTIPHPNFPFIDIYKIINGGTDYIERNAMVLIDLIEQINSCKMGSNPIKIIGFSMGGLVARYALRFMELNGIPHDADLFVSIDTPHKGAVVPIGLQELVDVIDDLVPFGSLDHIDAILNTPAAKQMLIHHYLANSQTPQGAPNFHDQFYNELNAMGFPQQTRNIAIVNGVATGDPINAPGQKYLEASGEAGFILAGLKAKTKLRYTPANGLTNDAFDFRLKLRLLIVNITIFKRIRSATTLATTGSYENTPGGFFDVAQLTRDFLGDDLAYNYFKINLPSTIFSYANVNLETPNFSFIPVKSALAFTGANENLYENFSDRNLVCTGETPFDSYYIPPENQEHIALTVENVDFIEHEILGIPQNPIVDGGGLILGSSTVCYQDTVFDLDACSVDATGWTVSDNLQIISTTPRSITVSGISELTKGFATITANFGNQSFPRSVYVGTPETPASLTGPTVVTTGAIVSYYGGVADGATSYKWHLPYPYETVNPIDYFGQNWQMHPTTNRTLSEAFTGYSKQGGLVQLMGENICGCGSAYILQVEHFDPGGGGGGNGGGPIKQPIMEVGGDIPKANNPEGNILTGGILTENNTDLVNENIIIYPNPANNQINILASSLNTNINIPKILYELQIFDQLGNKVIVKDFTKNGQVQAKIDVSNLSSGVYTIAIKTNIGVINKKIIVY